MSGRVPRFRRRHRQNGGRLSHPLEAHVFTFRFYGADDRRTGQLGAVVVRGRIGANGAIPTAYERAATLGPNPFCVDIRSCPSRALPEQAPKLDRICAEHTAFPRFLNLLVAVAGYRPSIRLDLMGQDGVVLARAYDRAQARRGDPRRAFLTE